MRIAHLILAHKNPDQLERLLKALDHPQFYFFIHLDLKVDIKDFIHLENSQRIFFIRNRKEVKWGNYSLVQAQLNGMAEIVAQGNYDYINVISAQDFPVESPETIYHFFKDHAGKEFISTVTFADDAEWWTIAQHRVNKYHFHNWKIPGKYRLQILVNQLLPKRKHPLNHIIVGRSQWFSITSACAQHILDFLKAHPEVTRYFKYVWGADEFIFSTVVYNSSFKDKVTDNLVYTDWSEKKPNPKLLTSADFNAVIHSGKLFARKFDLVEDANIFTMLEEWAKGRSLVH